MDGNCGSDLFDDDDGCSVVEIVYVSSGCKKVESSQQNSYGE